MEWPKLKNIILIILALTNLCLLFFVARGELQDRYLQHRARSDAIQFLADRGVTLTEDQVPDRTGLMAQIVERDLEREAAVAAQLLDGSVQAEDRGAGVYRYFNDKGSIQFHNDGTFSGEFAGGAFPVGEDREKDCLAILAKLDFRGELVAAQGDSITFRQLWEGVPLFNQQVTLEVRDGCLTAMTAGRRLVGQPIEDPTRETITAATALVELLNGINTLGGVFSQVDTIIPGYVSSTPLSGPTILTPVWHIVTDTGAYEMDMVTGTLSRVP